jgi:hypothetical protein
MFCKTICVFCWWIWTVKVSDRESDQVRKLHIYFYLSVYTRYDILDFDATFTHKMCLVEKTKYIGDDLSPLSVA